MTRTSDFNPPTPITRRQFAQFLGIAGAAATLPWKVEAQDGVQTLVFALPGLVGNFEPHTWVGFGDTVHVMDTVARGLTHMDFAKQLPQPAIAESWKI